MISASAVIDPLASVSSAPGGLEQDTALGVAIGIVDVDLHQETVELRFRQRIGSFLLQRVLRGEYMERLRQIVARAGHGDVLLLHRLEQRRLRARAGAVDLVGHQQLREHRAGDEAEGTLAAGALVEHFGAENVRWHQIGRELDALGIEAERDAERLDQLGLGETGDADQQRMAAGEDGDQRVLDHAVLAEDDGRDRILCRANLARHLLGRTDYSVFELLDTLRHPLAPSACHAARLRRHVITWALC
ncbi:hypothetical protein ACVW1A_004391 [Bradyrhizobium sp. LB1.3]